MPTTRRPVNRYAARGVQLTATLRELLLRGWTAPVPPDGHGDDPFEEFFLSDEDFAALWREHRSALLQEWTRRCGQGRPWAAERFEKDTIQ